VLLLASMFMFLRLIHKTTSGLPGASVLERLGRDAGRAIGRAYPDPAPKSQEANLPRFPDPPARSPTGAVRGSCRASTGGAWSGWRSRPTRGSSWSRRSATC
jgi:hypothetical protein